MKSTFSMSVHPQNTDTNTTLAVGKFYRLTNVAVCYLRKRTALEFQRIASGSFLGLVARFTTNNWVALNTLALSGGKALEHVLIPVVSVTESMYNVRRTYLLKGPVLFVE